MSAAQIKKRVRHALLKKESRAYVEAFRADSPDCTFTVVVGNTDLPSFISNGILYVQAPLPLIFEAFAEDLPAFVSDMEVRVSTKGGPAFSLDRDGRPIPSATVAEQGVVRNRSVER